ncbi:MAG: DUF885 domain-containing protein [Gemmatimonadetes bacterium]|nr:DUF885 domain-containing protein [Gemmatimonadota bacterium]
MHATIRSPVRGCAALAVYVTVAGCAESAPPPADTGPAELAAVAEDVWQRQLEVDLRARAREGLRLERLPIPTLDRAEADAEFSRSVLDRLEAIDSDALGVQDRLTREVLQRRASLDIEGLDHYWVITNVLTPYSSPIGGFRALFAMVPVDDARGREDYLTLLSQVPEAVGFVEALARGQMERGVVVPEPNMDAVVGIVRANAAPFDDGPFAVASARLGAEGDGSTPGGDAAAFLAAAAGIVDGEINPALQRLGDFLDGEYREAAPAEVGLSRQPGGEAAYRYLVRVHTTMDITPEEIHRIGLQNVAELEDQMLAVQARIGFEGSIDDFRRHIPTNPAYFPESVEEVKMRLETPSWEFFEQADELFLTKPEAPFAARRLDPALEGSQTFGYYNPPTPTDPVGYYNFNGSDLDQRSWLTYKGISFHELFPGHHFHITRQYANTDLPAVRRNALHTAYTEGWGMYSTFLGIDSGFLADDPLGEYGAYMMEIFVATRLVVDTGMNLLGWTLEEGRQYMRDHIFDSETQIATESLRYSTDMWGQALGYQMGKRAILDLRRRAEAALGDDFDLRRFHEAVLAPGSLPIEVLQSHIDRFIEEERAT